MKLKTIYLAGAIHGLSDAECNNWRDMATNLWGGPVLDPMRRDARGKEQDPKVVREVVEQDKQDIMQADGILVYFVKPSVGTSMEIMLAWLFRKPIALVNASMNGQPLSIWLSYHCAVFPDIASALNHLDLSLNS